MNFNKMSGPIMAAFILSVTCNVNAQQPVTDSQHALSPQASQSSDSTRAAVTTVRNAGKTRNEVLAELRQSQTDANPIPTGFLAYDAPAFAPKYETSAQHNVVK